MSSRWIIASLRILLLLLDIIVSHQWQYILQVFVGWFWRTNPLPDTLLTNTQRSSLSFTWKHFRRAQGLNPYHVFRYFYVTNTLAGAIQLKVQINSRSHTQCRRQNPTCNQFGCCCFSRHNSLQWRHNEHDGVSSHQPHDCLLNRVFRHRSNKTSKLRVTGLCERNSPVTVEFLAQMASNVENVSIWWCHHITAYTGKSYIASL